MRIRQYEDFFNPSGLATPDDTVVYEACQEGNASQGSPWLQGYARGMNASRQGPDQFADLIDLKPASSVAADRWLSDETIFHAYYRALRDRLMAVAQAEQAREVAA